MRYGIVFLCLSVLGSGLYSVRADQNEASDSHALLIAIDDYPEGSGFPPLQGPSNDTALIRELLVSRFGMPESNVTMLRESQVTHTGLETAFAELTRRVGPGDFVYIHYSGHGSEAEDLNGDERRSDKDQTWVTYGARAGRLDGIDDYDVLDDEINDWLIPLYEKTDRVVFVSDSCHSASVSRGRVVGVRAVVQDPRPHPLAKMDAKARFGDASAPGVRIGAARDFEKAQEVEVDGRSYGLFSWHWARALEQAKPGQTWEEVFARAEALVMEDSDRSQRPQLEGRGSWEVFGGEFREPSATLAVTTVDTSRRTVKIGAGSVNGVTSGSIYAVHDPTAAPDGLSRLQVTEVRAFESDGKILRGTFQPGDLVEEIEHSYDFEPIRVAVEGDFGAGRDAPLVRRLAQAVESLKGFAPVGKRSQADWLIYVLRPERRDGRYVYASERHTLPRSVPEGAPEAWVISPLERVLHENMKVPMDNRDAGIETLKRNLKTFARAEEIKRLKSRSSEAPIQVNVSVFRPTPSCERDCLYLPGDDREERPYAKVDTRGLEALASAELQSGDALFFEIENQGRQGYYVYLLDITGDGGVQAVFPLPLSRQEDAFLAKDEHRDLSEETGLLLDTPGRETIKLIAARQPLNVRLFEQEGYQEVQRRSGARGLNPLERLLAEAMYTRATRLSMREQDWGTRQVEIEIAAQ